MPVKSFYRGTDKPFYSKKTLCGLIALSGFADISTSLRHFFLCYDPNTK